MSSLINFCPGTNTTPKQPVQPQQSQNEKYKGYKPVGKVEIIPDGGGRVNTNTGGKFWDLDYDN